jgi:hypothetical protein
LDDISYKHVSDYTLAAEDNHTEYEVQKRKTKAEEQFQHKPAPFLVNSSSEDGCHKTPEMRTCVVVTFTSGFERMRYTEYCIHSNAPRTAILPATVTRPAAELMEMVRLLYNLELAVV